MTVSWKYAAVAGMPALLAITLAALLFVRAQSANATQNDLRLALSQASERETGLRQELVDSRQRISALTDELAELRQRPPWTGAHDMALEVATGSWRQLETLMVLADRLKLFSLPPTPEMGVSRLFLRDLDDRGIARKIGEDPDIYEITEWGQEVYAAYLELPDHILGLYTCLNWRFTIDGCSEHYGIMLDRARAAIPEE